ALEPEALQPVPAEEPPFALEPEALQPVPAAAPSEASPDAVTYCMSCGTALPPTAKFCRKCGTPVLAGDAPPPATETARPTPPPTRKKTIVCHACGGEQPRGEKYCALCGAPLLDDGPAATHTVQYDGAELSSRGRAAVTGPSTGDARMLDADKLARGEPGARPEARDEARPRARLEGGQRMIDFEDSGDGADNPVELERTLAALDSHYQEAPLAGRSREMKVLQAALYGALEGQARRMLIVAANGFGKSRLLTEVAAAAREMDFLAVHAWATRFGVPIGLDLFRQWVIGICGRLSEEPRGAEEIHRASVATATGWVTRLTLSTPLQRRLSQLLDGTAYELSSDPAVHRRRMETALRYFLWLVAQHVPLCLTADDLQAADAGTIKLLRTLVEHLGESRLAVIGAATPGSCETWFPPGEILSLGALDGSDVVHLGSCFLSSGFLPPPLERGLRGDAHGNPLLVTDTMRSLLDAKLLRFDGIEWRLLGGEQDYRSPSARRFVETRLNMLSNAARETVKIGALSGMVFSQGLITAAGAEKEFDGRIAIDSALGCGLLANLAGSSEIQFFRQSYSRLSIVESVDPARAKHIHLALAKAYRQAGEFTPALSTELATRHLLAAGATDQAFELVAEAARTLMQQGALEIANELFEVALGLGLARLQPNADVAAEQAAQLYQLCAVATDSMLPDSPGRASALVSPLLQRIPPKLAPHEAIQALCSRARAQIANGQPEEARATLDLATQTLPIEPNPVVRALLQVERAAMFDAVGQLAEAVDLTREALQIFASAPLQPGEAAEARQELIVEHCLRMGRFYQTAQRPDLAKVAVEKARAAAQGAGLSWREVGAMLAQVEYLTAPGQRGETIKLLAAARAQAEELGDPWILTQVHLALSRWLPKKDEGEIVQCRQLALRYGQLSEQEALVKSARGEVG
ncbi:MAG: AAA family ATPase, partial [Deltaproteobacteria bacterium]|nr:AAA family ATPase [Deltaproteobacteria bacterium]